MTFMLLKIESYKHINERKLMDVYAESNFENVEYFFPDEKDIRVVLRK